ncbi:Lrp/AsnC family transcriptional regulator [Rhodovibrionaceae bacterium A322]
MLDDLDRKLIGLLQDDARKATTELAKTLGVARATVQNRITKLQHLGVIARFTIELGQVEQDQIIDAFALVKMAAKDSRPLIAALRKIPEVTEIHTLNGTYDLIANIRVTTPAALDKVLLSIRILPEVSDTDSSIRLLRHK